MGYNNPCRKNLSRLSTLGRLGVVVVAVLFIATPVLANPVNPVVVSGSATFNQSGNVLPVTNNSGTIINWNKFSIAPGDTTKFFQPAASSSVLNGVLNNPAALLGPLSSSGRVWLVNPPGTGGSVYLTGTTATNNGIITTPKGETILAAGNTVSLTDSSTPGVKVDITGAKGNVTNLGAIMAEIGRVGIAGAMVRDSSRPNVSSVVNEGGRIFLQAGPNGQAPN